MRFLIILMVLPVVGCGLLTKITPARVVLETETRTLAPAKEDSAEYTVTLEVPAEKTVTVPIQDKEIKVPGPSKVTVAVATAQKQTGTDSTERKKVETVGPSVQGASGGIDVQTPPIKLNGIEVGVGGYVLKAQALAKKSPITLYTLGALCIIAAALTYFLIKSLPLSIGLGAGGFALIGLGVLIERYPWVILVAALLVLGLILWFVLSSKKTLDAFGAVVTAIEGLPAETQAPVKAAIGTQATIASAGAQPETTVRDTVTAVKRREGLK